MLSQYLDSRRDKLKTLIENRTVFSLNHMELNVYETFEECYNISMTFSHPVLVGMIQGRKVIHLSGSQAFDFIPRQTLILPAYEPMTIDFPDASLHTPTRCLALVISPEFILRVRNEVNEKLPRLDHQSWKLATSSFYVGNDPKVSQSLDQLVEMFLTNDPVKDLIGELKLKEVLIRIMQTEARYVLMERNKHHTSTIRLAVAVDFIKRHLHDRISVEELCKVACMSKALFFKQFKEELGVSPVEFIKMERVRLAQELLSLSGYSISDVAERCGFSSVAYFDRVFKDATGKCPTHFQHEKMMSVLNHPSLYHA